MSTQTRIYRAIYLTLSSKSGKKNHFVMRKRIASSLKTERVISSEIFTRKVLKLEPVKKKSSNKKLFNDD